MGLFALLRNPMLYITNDDMIFAFHEPFLWIDDLSQPDRWILPIIAGIATFISFTMNRVLSDTGANDQSAGMMKMMMYIFPIMILWMARSFPSGLALYWAVSQIIQIFFNIHMSMLRKKIKREAEEKRIREKISK
jgi:YidC/Oxa1 family membrane protein insertase